MSADEEVRAIRAQLEAAQKALDISDAIIKDLTAEVDRLRAAGTRLNERHSAVCQERDALKARLEAKS